VVYVGLSEIYLVLFSQEVGVGFKKASEPELANRRQARPFPTKFNPQLILLFYPRVKALPKRASLGGSAVPQPTNSEQLVRVQGKRDLKSCFSLSTVS